VAAGDVEPELEVEPVALAAAEEIALLTTDALDDKALETPEAAEEAAEEIPDAIEDASDEMEEGMGATPVAAPLEEAPLTEAADDDDTMGVTVL